jgi:hypothetical protein
VTGSDEWDEAYQKALDVTYLSGAHRSHEPQKTEPIQTGTRVVDQTEHVEWQEDDGRTTLRTTPAGRQEVVATFGARSRELRRLLIQRFFAANGRPMQQSISFDAAEAQQVVRLLRDIAVGQPEDAPTAVVDEALLEALRQDRSALQKLYDSGGRERLDEIIRSDVSAKDVVAAAARRAQVTEFRRMLEDDEYFDRAAATAGGPERLWQQFFEKHHWLFGLGLCHTFLTAWDPARLEQVTTGQSVSGPGKRTDALLRTTGFVRSLAFVEIKDHRAMLLQKDPNRSGVWAPSRPLVEAVAQLQRTVDEAMFDFGKKLEELDDEGNATTRYAHLVYPRSFVVVGSTKQLTAGTPGTDNEAKFRSFELYRGTLAHPEVITYDELLARAEYIVGD